MLAQQKTQKRIKNEKPNEKIRIVGNNLEKGINDSDKRESFNFRNHNTY